MGKFVCGEMSISKFPPSQNSVISCNPTSLLVEFVVVQRLWQDNNIGMKTLCLMCACRKWIVSFFIETIVTFCHNFILFLHLKQDGHVYASELRFDLTECHGFLCLMTNGDTGLYFAIVEQNKVKIQNFVHFRHCLFANIHSNFFLYQWFDFCFFFLLHWKIHTY